MESTGDTPSILRHNGKEMFRGTHNECLMKLHRLQGQSWDYALTYGRWAIEKDPNANTKETPKEPRR